MPLQITSPDPEQHREPMLDLIAKVFSHSGYFNFRNHCRDGYVADSHYDWRASRIGLIDGQIVSHFGVWDYRMRIGSARVRVGGIGVVATHGDHRKRGYMARTAMASIHAMQSLGYDMSILFGIDEFYWRFGYVRAWSEQSWSVRTGDLPSARPAGAIRAGRFRPTPDLVALFNRQSATITGTALRPTYRPAFLAQNEKRRMHIWTTGRGRPAGYVVVERKGSRLECIEAIGEPEQALRVLGRLARKAGLEEVRFETLPAHSPLARRLAWDTCRVETRHHRRGGAMVRTINLPSTLTRMRSELWQRLRGSALADWRGDLLIDDGRQQAVLRIGTSGIEVTPPASRPEHAIRGDDRIAQLLIGTDQPLETARAAGMRLTGAAGRLLPALFPAQAPQLHQADRY